MTKFMHKLSFYMCKGMFWGTGWLFGGFVTCILLELVGVMPITYGNSQFITGLIFGLGGIWGGKMMVWAGRLSKYEDLVPYPETGGNDPNPPRKRSKTPKMGENVFIFPSKSAFPTKNRASK